MTRPIIAICGTAGTGKSTEMLKTAQDCFLFKTAANNDHYYSKLLKTKLKDTHKFPKKTKLVTGSAVGISKDDYTAVRPEDMNPCQDTAGNPLNLSMTQELARTLATLLAGAKKSPGAALPFKWLVIDEFGLVLDSIFSEIEDATTTKDGKANGLKAYGGLNDWILDLFKTFVSLSACGMGIGLVMHHREPDGEKQGGLYTPSRRAAALVSQGCDIVIQRYLKDAELGSGRTGTMRLWRADASERWDLKARGLDPEEFPLIAEMELSQIIELCGFEV